MGFFYRSLFLVSLIFSPLFGEPQNKKIGLVIAAFDRPQFLKKTLESLKKNPFGHEDLEIVIIDDCSSKSSIEKMIDRFHLHDHLLFRIRVPKNQGIANALSLGWSLLASRGCDYLCNIDSDVLVKPHWLKTILNTYLNACDDLKTSDIVISGFNTKNHPIKKECSSFFVKESLGGVNLFFPTKMFYTHVQKALLKQNLWDWSLVKLMKDDELPLICTKPSVVQHIGVIGMNSNLQCFDVAEDF